jgi:hypothetical protein
MNIWYQTTKIFALLFFVSYLTVYSQTDSVYQLPAGMKIHVQMDNEINSEVSGVNDTFTTKIDEPVKVRGVIVLPVGTIIEGRVTKVERASYGGKNGKLSVKFETLRLETGEKREIEGVLVNELNVESSQKFNIFSVVGGAGLGALIGAVAKKESGALIGAGIGAGIGTGVALARKGKNVRIKTNEEFDIQLTKEVTLPVKDY